MRITIHLKRIIELMVSLMIFLSFIDVYSGWSNTLVLYAILFLGTLLQLYNMSFKKISNRVQLFQFLLFISGLFNIAFVGNMTLLLLLRTVLITYPISVYFLYGDISSKFWKRISILLLGFVLYSFYILEGGVRLFPFLSRNYVSVYLIFLIFLCFFKSKNPHHLLIPIIFSFGVSISAIGRGGILTFLIMLLIFLGIYSLQSIKKFFSFIFLLLLMFIAYQISDFNLENVLVKYFPRLAGIESGVQASNFERHTFLEVYWTSMKADFFDFLFGVPFEKINIKNVHNSFLQFHSSYGIFPLMLFIISICTNALKFLKNRNLHLVIFLGFTIRSLTDSLFPGNLVEIVLFYYCFYYWAKSDLELGDIF